MAAKQQRSDRRPDPSDLWSPARARAPSGHDKNRAWRYVGASTSRRIHHALDPHASSAGALARLAEPRERELLFDLRRQESAGVPVGGGADRSVDPNLGGDARALSGRPPHHGS